MVQISWGSGHNKISSLSGTDEPVAHMPHILGFDTRSGRCQQAMYHAIAPHISKGRAPGRSQDGEARAPITCHRCCLRQPASCRTVTAPDRHKSSIAGRLLPVRNDNTARSDRSCAWRTWATAGGSNSAAAADTGTAATSRGHNNC